uniref:Deoxyuridine 5'-triphosphate nucleotidohydrolase, mitochondrial isoform 1 n=1 Tax=Sus scrofa TaxID=9823 RepID=A0A480XS24_PIG
MTSLCLRPMLGYHFLPSRPRLVFNRARTTRPGAEAAGLSGPASPLDPAPPGVLQLPLSSTRSLSRGCRGASNVRAQSGRIRFPRRSGGWEPGQRPPRPPGPQTRRDQIALRISAVGEVGGRATPVVRERTIRVPPWRRGGVFYWGMGVRPPKLQLTLNSCIEFGEL